MWYFASPKVVFGEGALDALDELAGRRALLITDAALVQMGLVDRVHAHLRRAGMQVHIFDAVEPDPSVQTVIRGAQVAQDVQPDWIVAVGGGSPMDAAKAIWVLYERPDLEPAAINPLVELGLRQKARLVTIPTTSGTGAEVTWFIVLTDTLEQRKMGVGSRENLADIAIVDPAMAAGMPPRLTADTGLDALTHAIESYACTWHTDYCDGLGLSAARNILTYLPRAVADGSDMEARERMHNAATCAGLAFGNTMASMAHALGHTLGALFHVPHGRAVALFLPYTIEFIARDMPQRYAELAAWLGCAHTEPVSAARALAERIRALSDQVGNPTSVAELGITRAAYEAQLLKMVDDANNDSQMIAAARLPSYEELQRLFVTAYAGETVNF